MEIMQGRVAFTRMLKPCDYESKSATVELTFTTSVSSEIAETETAIAGDIAFRRVMAMVYRPDEKSPSSGIAVPAVEKTQEPLARPRKRTKEELSQIVIGAPKEADKVDALDGLFGEEPAPLTDAELHSLATKTNERLRDAHKIRDLVCEFVGPPPAGMRQIPPEKRGEFAKRLEALR